MLPNICFVSFFVTLFTETKYQLGVFSEYCRVTWKLDNITEGHIMVSKTNETNDIHVVKLVHSFVVLKMNFVRWVCKIKMQIYISILELNSYYVLQTSLFKFHTGIIYKNNSRD